ncbi:MAG: STN domain-containing protein, partial [Parabacteroides sp.]
MNKKSFSDTVVQKRYLQKHFFRIMRTTAFLLFLFVFCLSAENTNSQNVNVTLKSNNIELEKVLNEIEKQTDFLFVYNNHVNVNRIVSVNLKKASLERTLEHLFKGTNVKYSIDGTYILLSTNDAITKSPSVVVVDQQQNQKHISGTVIDASGQPIIG